MLSPEQHPIQPFQRYVMTALLRPARALLSVSDKQGLEAFAKGLAAAGVALISTGGTAAGLRAAGLAVEEVSQVTGFPEIMEGRVKTLHPKVHGGLLAKRDQADHRSAMEAQGIEPIDLLVVNLYPFEETLAAGGSAEELIEKIDVGGPAMLRGAAKNHAFVAVVSDPADYDELLAELARDGGITAATRARLAAKTFALTASYDAAIAGWLASQEAEPFPARFTLPGRRLEHLRYGENPHQAAAVYRGGGAVAGAVTAKQRQGKALSYNNLADADAAFDCVAEFEEPAVVIVKHGNPCGAATADSQAAAYEAALACDPVSAFGGIVALNRPLDLVTAELIAGLFTEVVIAPGFDETAALRLADKASLRLLDTGALPDPAASRLTVKSLAGGFLLQERDGGKVTAEALSCVTKRQPGESELRDLLFAFKVCKHVRSNAIVYARDGATVGVGAGQMSRVDSARIAAWKAESAFGAEGAKGSVVASDAFFPFADGLEAVSAAGATAVIQPGGSQRDAEVIAAADRLGLAMVFTGIRHFRH
ncbi:MAG: bifunctional phosphoribosylaminoimidazolecarboxamide formyltransferase/IMP cyclohydrolase [Rhodospirillales bacterium]